MTVKPRFAEIALPVPLRRTFDYLLPISQAPTTAGMRVLVPFARRSLVGVVIAVKHTSDVPQHQLRTISEVLDEEPILSASLLKLLQWGSNYYHHPLGDVVAAALPARLRTRTS